MIVTCTSGARPYHDLHSGTRVSYSATDNDGTGNSTESHMYICPNDFYCEPVTYRNPYEQENISVRLDNIPFQYWSRVLDLKPHMIPNHYEPAPMKLEFKTESPKYIHKDFKQPVSRSGFKRGQRRQHDNNNN